MLLSKLEVARVGPLERVRRVRTEENDLDVCIIPINSLSLRVRLEGSLVVPLEGIYMGEALGDVVDDQTSRICSCVGRIALTPAMPSMLLSAMVGSR